jgi:hypothetical protein
VSDNGHRYNIPVVDTDQAFPAMVDHDGLVRGSSSVSGDVGPQVNSALRDLLGWRPRVEDPKAFVDALNASFRLIAVQGHVEAQFVPRGYAVQADLGAVSGGQASLYRRALISRTEMLRILDGLTPLRTDADVQDMEAYRTLVRGAAERLVDEVGTAGGPRVDVIDNYFRSLTGTAEPQDGVIPDTVAGQLGALRERFGLIDANVNTVEEEGIRTSFWTLVDMVVDLQKAWDAQRKAFTGGAGAGFIGTELILLSRLMEATADQVDEMEAVFDSVLIGKSERRTLVLDASTNLTLDGLLLWMRSFLGEEGRRIVEETGRDGIVSTFTPTVIKLSAVFEKLQKRVSGGGFHITHNGQKIPVIHVLPASCTSKLPAGMRSARSRIAVASTCRLLRELVTTAQRIGRYPAVVLTDVLFDAVYGREDVIEVEFRGFNLRPSYIPAFIKYNAPAPNPTASIARAGTTNKNIIYALRDSATANDESLAGLFRISDLEQALDPQLLQVALAPFRRNTRTSFTPFSISLPAEDLRLTVIDGELGEVIHAPNPVTWPSLRRANKPVKGSVYKRWDTVPRDEVFGGVPAEAIIDPDLVDPPPQKYGGGNVPPGGGNPPPPGAPAIPVGGVPGGGNPPPPGAPVNPVGGVPGGGNPAPPGAPLNPVGGVPGGNLARANPGKKVAPAKKAPAKKAPAKKAPAKKAPAKKARAKKAQGPK